MTPPTTGGPRMRPLFLVVLAIMIIAMITILATNASQQQSKLAAATAGGGAKDAAGRTGGSLVGVGGDMMDLDLGGGSSGSSGSGGKAGGGGGSGAGGGGAGKGKEDAVGGAAAAAADSGADSGAGSRKPADPMMSKMGNETLKAELGRAAWKLIHTMAGKYPYKPTSAQQTTMTDFIYSFAQVYPCGECARHFKLVLEKHPPNVTNRDGLSQWACKVHNVVNERLKKPKFDCSKVGDMYKCGCSEEELESLFAKPTSI